jgi:hypothetical protein
LVMTFSPSGILPRVRAGWKNFVASYSWQAKGAVLRDDRYFVTARLGGAHLLF